ncbi:hypothetical protein [Magnetospirillum gryphiswaldense]|uniref:Fe(3+)-citrate import system permease protein yfmD n=2 Tax=Magnetospirillum gryphiswaldense TaxID=55518 RepID=V6F751_MAGGM|nr:hypothetical protein [Magnetospirillum gryphiswaldense]AVM75289.1 hypothetical protein MSR1_28200 [Magnetospirillum gryphiswaldense MSR-1]AVM79192.1 hypothetical protein MSR1L_28200 [Magnetospirillum gryphiswaldense]CAM76278.1 ABC-type Fe3+-siderophore transport system, permease component [Magnetospirillum gryphiswaldense MSR-1]CDL00303.1 Fe(3+)-citrate import system permease protein yfmD [Magnetospirillum gryphiswaldense MSR-1 v2]
MLLGRIVGWFLIAVTVVMASGDAVLALGPADYAGILTADVITLLVGAAPEPAPEQSLFAALEAVIMDLPAWVVVGMAGTALLVASRKRNKRFRFRRAA